MDNNKENKLENLRPCIPNIEQFYLWGNFYDIATNKWGVCQFIRVKDYPKLVLIYQEYINMNHTEFLNKKYNKLREIYGKEKEETILKIMKPLEKFDNVYDCLMSDITNEMRGIFNEVFNFFFKNETNLLGKIESKGEFEEVRTLIRRMNCITYEKPTGNEELDMYNAYDKMLEKAKSNSGDITMDSILSGLIDKHGESVYEWTLFTLSDQFARRTQGENVKISRWSMLGDNPKVANIFTQIDILNPKDSRTITTMDEIEKEYAKIEDPKLIEKVK